MVGSWKLTIRYRSCRYEKSETNSDSIVLVVTRWTVPSWVTTRASTITVAYASFSFTRPSRNGSISSRAQASLMMPVLCKVPSSSTYPFGRVKGNSVCNPLIQSLLRHALLALVSRRRGARHPIATRCSRSCSVEPFVGDDHLFGGDLVGAGVELGAGPLGDPAALEVPAGDL